MAIEKSLFLLEYWVKTLSAWILHRANRGIEIARSSFNLIIWTHLYFWTRFSAKKTDFSSFLKVSISSFLLLLQYPIKNVISHPFSGFLIDQDWHKVLLVLTCLDNQYLISQLYLLHFAFDVSIDCFLLESDCLFLKLTKFAFYIGFGVLIDPMWHKFY